MEQVAALERKFRAIKEVEQGNAWVYSYDYETGIQELDAVLLKYIPFFTKRYGNGEK